MLHLKKIKKITPIAHFFYKSWIILINFDNYIKTSFMKKAILLFLLGLLSIHALHSQTRPTPDSVEVIIVFKNTTTTATINAFRTVMKARQLDYTTPSRARLWRIPYPLVGTLPNGTPFSFTTPTGAVGVISNETEAVSLNSLTETNDTNFDVSPSFDTRRPLTNCSNSPILCTNTGLQSNSKIVVLDGGIDKMSGSFLMRHIDTRLAKNMIDGTSNIHDAQGHGNQVTSIIVHYLDKLIPTTSTHKTIIPLKIFENGRGKIYTAIKAMDVTTNMRINNIDIRLINCSFISCSKVGEHGNKTPFQCAIEKARDRGILVTCAAGNSSINLDINKVLPFLQQDIYEPAMLPTENIICVGASTCNSTKASFSNYGLVSVDLFTNGEQIYTMGTNNRGVVGSGTSFACPIVSGAIISTLLQSASIPSYTTIKNNILNAAKARRLSTLVPLCVTGGLFNFTVDVLTNANCVWIPFGISTSFGTPNFLVYPNPSSGIATIKFDLEQEQTVSLNIYDLQGRLVQTIVPQGILPKGQHQFALENYAILRGGVYFCHLKTEEELKVQKLFIKE